MDADEVAAPSTLAFAAFDGFCPVLFVTAAFLLGAMLLVCGRRGEGGTSLVSRVALSGVGVVVVLEIHVVSCENCAAAAAAALGEV